MFAKIFPCALVLFIALGTFAVSVSAQNGNTLPKQLKPIVEVDDAADIDDEPVIVSQAAITSTEEIKLNRSFTFSSAPALNKFQPLLFGAIEERLGSRYHWGSTGPYTFDCSGFVWSSFRSAGIDFERSSARALWSRFEAPPPEEQFKFGTLVFFNRQHHVGIVADEKGFFHASRHHGVVYAKFEGYWGKHIDGFRRVPVPVTPIAQMQRTD